MNITQAIIADLRLMVKNVHSNRKVVVVERYSVVVVKYYIQRKTDRSGGRGMRWMIYCFLNEPCALKTPLNI